MVWADALFIIAVDVHRPDFIALLPASAGLIDQLLAIGAEIRFAVITLVGELGDIAKVHIFGLRNRLIASARFANDEHKCGY